jgi:hypothetical protein
MIEDCEFCEISPDGTTVTICGQRAFRIFLLSIYMSDF